MTPTLAPRGRGGRSRLPASAQPGEVGAQAAVLLTPMVLSGPQDLHLRRRRLLRRLIYTSTAVFAALPPRQRELLRTLPGLDAAKALVRRRLI